jgi:hypothetical protein
MPQNVNMRARTLTFKITFAGLLNFKFHLKMKDPLTYLSRRYRMSNFGDCPLSTAVKSGWIKGQHKIYPTRQNQIFMSHPKQTERCPLKLY